MVLTSKQKCNLSSEWVNLSQNVRFNMNNKISIEIMLFSLMPRELFAINIVLQAYHWSDLLYRRSGTPMKQYLMTKAKISANWWLIFSLRKRCGSSGELRSREFWPNKGSQCYLYPYSPDFAHCDLLLFSKLENSLKV